MCSPILTGGWDPPMADWLTSLLDLFGEWGVILTFLGSMLENIAVIGTFTPGDVIVVASALGVKAREGSMIAVALATILGVIAGNNITYLVFRSGGRDLLIRIGRWASGNKFISKFIRIDEESLSGTEEFFRNHGAKAVFFARFVTGFKSYIIAVAGISRMRFRDFQLFTLLSAILYSVLLVTIGWFVGSNLESAMTVVSRIGIVGLAVFVVFIGSIIFRRFNKQTARLESLAEERAETEECLALRGSDEIELTRLADARGISLHFKDSTTSTNDDVRTLALQGAPEGTAVVSSEQTAGRGRRGNTWSSPRGGSYSSLLLRPRFTEGEKYGLIPLVVAVGIAEGLELIGIRDVGLKWPNDLMIGEAKLGGILCETIVDSTGERVVVCGMGINLYEPPAGPARTSGEYPSITLEDAFSIEPLPSTELIIVTILESVLERYRAWVAEEDDTDLLARYSDRMVGVGDEVRILSDDPGLERTGTIVGIDSTGRLVLDDGTQHQHLSSGSISVRKGRAHVH